MVELEVNILSYQLSLIKHVQSPGDVHSAIRLNFTLSYTKPVRTNTHMTCETAQIILDWPLNNNKTKKFDHK